MMNVGNVMTWIIIVCHILGAFLLYYEDRDKIRGSLNIFHSHLPVDVDMRTCHLCDSDKFLNPSYLASAPRVNGV